jgi:hypothetical protein
MKPLSTVSPLLLLAATLVACTAERKSAEAPPSAPEGQAAPASAPRAEAMVAAPERRAPSPRPETGDADEDRQPATTTRAMALSQARADVEAAQRELDVAGGDCRNACRALGSMDRAAGRICGLAQSDDEERRCGDAKVRVYSARHKVKSTCGGCPDVSVERTDPIPSR